MRRSLFLVACLVHALSLFAQSRSLETTAQDAFVISRMVEKFHVQPRPLDEEMSAAIYSRTLEALDDQHIFFTQQDLRQLSVYRTRLSDEIRNRQFTFLQLLVSIYTQRLMQADTMLDQLSGKPFNFTLREKLTLAEDSAYPADRTAMRAKICQLLKYSIVSKMATYIVQSGRAPSQKLEDSLEARYRKKAVISVKRSIKRVLQSPAGIDHTIGIIYCQALAVCYDPHTAFFPPDEKAAFETELGNAPLSYGLALSEDEDGTPLIGHLQPGGPAFQSGSLNEGDKILSIQWDDKEPIDVSNAELREINDILATEGGSKVTLNVKKSDGTTRQVSLHKERVATDDDEDKVKGFILKGTKTVGYISLPAFYSDWEDSKGVNGCANDVAKEIIKLKKENIGGLILDLRYNGGGSMEEAIELSGLFIDAGPVAQIKTRDAKVITLKDVNRGTVYDGPLLLLVNGSSASASEMVAGTLQDYNRALIVGSPTYGKATAQVVLPMDTSIDLATYQGKAEASSYLKLTIEKLYRITGATAQVSGVQPDITLPDPPDAIQQREAEEKFVLKAAVIDANKYYRALPPLPVAAVQARAKTALATDLFFKEALHHPAAVKQPGDQKEVSLYLDDMLQEKRKEAPDTAGMTAAAMAAATDSTDKNSLFVVTNHAYEQRRIQADHDLQETNEERKENVLYDPYVKIAYQLVSVMMP